MKQPREVTVSTFVWEPIGRNGDVEVFCQVFHDAFFKVI